MRHRHRDVAVIRKIRSDFNRALNRTALHRRHNIKRRWPVLDPHIKVGIALRALIVPINNVRPQISGLCRVSGNYILVCGDLSIRTYSYSNC